MPPLDDAVKHFLALYCLPLLLAFCLVGGVLVVRNHDRDVAANAVLARQVQVEHQLVDRWKVRYARAATDVQHDSIVITHWVPKYNKARDTILARITDTLLVREFVAAADSTIHACTELLNSCSVFRVTADSTIHAQDAENAVLREAVKANRPSALSRAWNAIKMPLAFSAGLYVGQRLH